ncbi:DNA binding domain-containing protein, excisionase family [Syntrophus gentianae]|uniref:DNA binding domain-containing protein, excisionase family n=1 Tax=Syntrophus gentianae TaxID=43775 RepID=A0A1H8BI17_9BACT|nr:helix-turn-helix domain-containing protein [Syntrophus gentianae]SEM82109.1 DNA binding domain-containing protein, excisionase family [Syntrophus gentianae]
MKEMVTDRFISVQAVADMLSCTEHHVYDLIRDGRLQAIKIGQRALRISWNSLQDFIATAHVDPEDYLAP